MMVKGIKFLVVVSLFSLMGCGNHESAVVDVPSVVADSSLFQIAELPEIKLAVSTIEWNKLLSYYDQNSKNEEYVLSDFILNRPGETILLDSIAIRLRGNTSRRRPEGVVGQVHNTSNPDWHHSHFAVSFSKYKKKQRLEGLEKINLKWFKDDANYVREIYCYDLFRRFGVWTAPKASYCRLSIGVKEDAKPAYFGVYGMIESIDEDYLLSRKDKWGADLGFLWKCTYNSAPADFVSKSSMGVEEVYLNENLSKRFNYDLKTRKKELATGQSQLAAFIDNLNSKSGSDFEAWIDQKLDVDLLLRAYAVNVIVGMWDDYWVNGNNFYFYFDANGKAYFIPYDYDNTLGTSAIIANSGTQNVMRWGNMNSRPLITKVLAIPRYAEQYKAYLRELVDPTKDYFSADKSYVRISNWHSLIRQYVSNDTHEDMSIGDAPASWGNASFYRLMEGNDLGGQSGVANFFKTRARNIP